MGNFFLRRLLRALPSLLILWGILFVLYELSPGNTAEDLLSQEQKYSTEDIDESLWRNYVTEAKNLGLQLPAFYITLRPQAYDPRLRKILLPQKKEWFREWCLRGISYDQLLHYQEKASQIAESCGPQTLNRWKTHRFSHNPSLDNSGLFLCAEMENVVVKTESRPLSVLPIVEWHGTQNRFHLWTTQLFTHQVSSQDGRSVWLKIGQASIWTIVLALLALLLSYVLSVLLGLLISRSPDAMIPTLLRTFLYSIYSIPLFWSATLAVTFLTTAYYSPWLDWFPAAGIFDLPANKGTWSILWINSDKLILPLILLTVYSLPFITEHFGESLKDERQKAYHTSLLARGLNPKRIERKHILPNASFSLITILGSRLSGLLSGSLVIEVIFGIPGMGKLLFDAVLTRDWSVIWSVTLLTALITIMAYLLVDLLYRWANPKLKWS